MASSDAVDSASSSSTTPTSTLLSSPSITLPIQGVHSDTTSQEGRPSDITMPPPSTLTSSISLPTNVVPPRPMQDVDRRQSAEEVIEEALEFDRSFSSRSRFSFREHLYPSLDRIRSMDNFDDDDGEEEKREIVDDLEREESRPVHRPTFGGAVPVATEEATVLDASASSLGFPETHAILNDDEELLAMKRAACGDFNQQLGVSGVGRFQIGTLRPVPLYDESADDFFVRTAGFWMDEASRWLHERGTSATELAVLEQKAKALAIQHYRDSGVAASVDREATVVSITDDIHPADPLSRTAVEAELIGQDYSRTADVVGMSSPDQGQVVANGYASGEVTAEENEAAEATVIDSAPLRTGNEDIPDWKREEAQVLEEDFQFSVDERKPSAINQLDSGVGDGHITVADQVAEVTGIDDDIHPLEFDSNGAEAELVGTDYSTTGEIPSNRSAFPSQNLDGELGAERAVVTSVQDSIHPSHFPDNDAQAELVGTDYPVNVPERDSTGFEQSTSVGEATFIEDHQATSVMTTQEVHATIVEQDSAAGGDERQTSSSEADLRASTITSNEASMPQSSAIETSWMSAPSSIGQDDVPPAVALPATSEATPEATTGKRAAGEDDLDEIPEWLRDTAPPPARRFGGVEPNSSTFTQAPTSISSTIARSTSNVMEALFGDTPPFSGRRSPLTVDRAVGSVLPRTLLPWSVIFSPPTGMWVATLQTNQKALDRNNVMEASKSLRAFSLPTEKNAVCLARSWTPPRMLSFSNSLTCHICQAKFAVFRRACHCRNCGVCICRDCAVQWPCKMIPDTYNLKNESFVNVCKTCDWLNHTFRLSLLDGDFDKSVALYSTGNVNIYTPFLNVKGETFYPVHCAVIGGSLQLLRWLVDEHCCPIKSVRVSGISKDKAGKYTPIVTSRGRSLLGIAMENSHIDIVRYLVVKKGISLLGEKDITSEMLAQNLEAVLWMVPDQVSNGNGDIGGGPDNQFQFPLFDDASAPVANGLEEVVPIIPHQDGRTLSEETRDTTASDAKDEASDHRDECIICFDNVIDCVANPCGHQVMCLECAENVSRCPVCAADCTFIKVYRP